MSILEVDNCGRIHVTKPYGDDGYVDLTLDLDTASNTDVHASLRFTLSPAEVKALHRALKAAVRGE